MLKELKIVNLALIQELHVFFESNLIIFTGETGAGKSIILQAIDLLSGKRGGSGFVRDGEDNARIDALFDISQGKEIAIALQSMGVEFENELVISRILSAKGSSRFYLNGSPSSAKMVGKITEYLLSVASQHDHQLLLNPKHHLDIVDLSGDLWSVREAIGRSYAEWLATKKRYEELCSREQEKSHRLALLSFQVKEIRDAGCLPGEDEELMREKKMLKGVSELRHRGGTCFSLLSETAIESLGVARKELEYMAVFDDSLQELASLVAEQSYMVEESVSRLRGYLDELPQSSERLDTVTERIDLLQKLKRKYGPSLEDVEAFALQAEKELDEIEGMETLLKQAQESYSAAGERLRHEASILSQKRKRAAAQLSQEITRELSDLSLGEARFEVFFEPNNAQELDAFRPTGVDRVEFLFSANPGAEMKPLARIASGGELSRLTLAMKCILAKKDMVETVIFDEIDAGVGGKAAEAVAEKISTLARHHQVFCITHLPQIAAGAKEHFYVQKKVQEGRTVTSILPLSRESRIDELARMLDGATVSQQSRAFAAELIQRHNARAHNDDR